MLLGSVIMQINIHVSYDTQYNLGCVAFSSFFSPWLKELSPFTQLYMYVLQILEYF